MAGGTYSSKQRRLLGAGPGLLLLLALLAACAQHVAARNFYDLLSVPQGASEQQIKRSYRKLALKYHPDKVTGTEAEKAEAAKHFAEINHAYETLSDPEKRQIYDQYGEEGLRQHAGQQGGGHPGGNIFDMFFGGGSPFGQQQDQEERTPKGHDVVVDLFVSLKDLYVGKEITTVRDKPVLRPASGTRRCKCKQKLITRQLGPGMFQQFTQNVCEECPAVKVEREKETINVHVEPGMVEGQEIQFFEEGEPMVDGEPGDLTFKVRTLPHALFKRSGNDLLMDKTISLVDALTGFRQEFEHLDGHKVVLESSKVTRPGDVQTVEGEGMPVYDSASRGRLLVTYTVDFPASLTEEVKATVRDLFGAGNGAAAAA
ncbi:dnaJ-like protein subfamily B member 11-like protein [Scenedesmus sp. NREL 46B-D3]|nr:dnaJ-like protein subfamily B member 11-like protein [Scenedesmus sp. NREL 46B-D3]